MSELRECPFCGGAASSFRSGVWSVACKCGARSGYYSTEAEAIAAWNQRATDTELGRLRKLEQAIRALTWVQWAGRWMVSLPDATYDTDEIHAIGRLLGERE